MTDFKAKMHQIRFRLGLRTRPCWGELTALPQTPSWIWGSLRGRGLDWAGGQEGKGREGKWRGGKGRAPKLMLNRGPSEPCYATVSILPRWTGPFTEFSLVRNVLNLSFYVTVESSRLAFNEPMLIALAIQSRNSVLTSCAACSEATTKCLRPLQVVTSNSHPELPAWRSPRMSVTWVIVLHPCTEFEV